MYISSSPPIRSYSAGYWSTRLRLFRYFHLDISTSTSETVKTQKRSLYYYLCSYSNPGERGARRPDRSTEGNECRPVGRTFIIVLTFMTLRDTGRQWCLHICMRDPHMTCAWLPRPLHSAAKYVEPPRASPGSCTYLRIHILLLLLTSSSAQILVVGGRSTRQSQR